MSYLDLIQLTKGIDIMISPLSDQLVYIINNLYILLQYSLLSLEVTVPLLSLHSFLCVNTEVCYLFVIYNDHAFF